MGPRFGDHQRYNFAENLEDIAARRVLEVQGALAYMTVFERDEP